MTERSSRPDERAGARSVATNVEATDDVADRTSERLTRGLAGELAAMLRRQEELGHDRRPVDEVRALWEAVRTIRQRIDAAPSATGAHRGVATPARADATSTRAAAPRSGAVSVGGATATTATTSPPASPSAAAHPMGASVASPKVASPKAAAAPAPAAPSDTSTPTRSESTPPPATPAPAADAPASTPLWGRSQRRAPSVAEPAPRPARRADDGAGVPSARERATSADPPNTRRPPAPAPHGRRTHDDVPVLPPPTDVPEWQMYEDLDALPPPTWEGGPPPDEPVAARAEPPPPAPATPAQQMEQARRTLGDCRACRLCETRRTIVWGTGNPSARLFFVGEGPGEQEDRTGEPFVGKAGELLTRMIEAMGLQRSDVYIANIVKCRPPGNRAPHDDEVAACLGNLRRQIEIVQPEVLVGLGATATSSLLGSRTAISRLRGTWQTYASVPLLPTFHPAYLLRTPAAKRDAWADLQTVMTRLGLPAQRT